jgi:hypothetical protein
MSNSGWVVPNFYKAPQDSLFDKEYDYFVSLGHRCCVGQALNYMRKSSFPFDWQVTKMSTLASIFKNEFKNFYPDSGVDFAHVIYYQDENNQETDRINEEATYEIYNRRSKRLVKLIKENERRLLFVRHKYVWYWSKWPGHAAQYDANPVGYDIQQLVEVSDILKNQYGNDKFEILYVYQDMNEFKDFEWDEKGEIDQESFKLPSGTEQMEQAKQFTYVEQLGFKDKHITPVVVKPNNVRVEGNAMCSAINSFVNLSTVQDFDLPYGFEQYKLTRNIDVE